MAQVFTIYNCGTNFHRDSDDVVARLWKDTRPPHLAMINDGPGGGTWKPNLLGGRSNAGGASKLGGLLFGVGVDANVVGAIHRIATLDPLPRVVNLCGWSRGGVTCSKISNLLQRMGVPLSMIGVNIFAIDPVPGSNLGSGHMWRNIAITQNVRFYNAVLSQHDNRGVDDFFQPAYPDTSGSTKVDVDIMPGSHSSICVFKGNGQEETAELVMDMAKRFLLSHGTRFYDPSLLNGVEILTRYGLIQQNFEYYTRLKSKALANMADTVRTIKDDKGQIIGGMRASKPRFFINEHHREVFGLRYPYLRNEIDREAPFDRQWARHWGREIDQLMAECFEQAKALLVFGSAVGAWRR